MGRFHVTDLHVQIRRLPKPVVAMVAGYAVGGGHILHLVCDLTIAADNARFGQTGPRVGSWDGGFGASLLRDLVGTKRAKEFWLLCRQYDARQALEMGLVNAVVPLDRLEEETVQWCREMLALSPFALRLAKAGFNAHEDGYAGVQQLGARRQPAVLRLRGGAGGARRLPREAPAGLLALPAPAVTVADRPSAARIWLMAARPRTLPAAVAPVLVGTALAATEGTFKPLTLPRRARRRAVHPGGDEPLQRLLRRAPRRRHGGPARAGARHRRRAGAAAPGADRDGRGVRRRGAGRHVPDRDRRVGAAGRRGGLDPGRHPLHRRAAPYGYEGLGEVFVFLFFGVVAVAGSYFAQTETLAWEALVLAVPVGLLASARSSSSTTSATWRPTGGRASGRWRCGSAASGRGGCTWRWSRARSSPAPLPWWLGSPEVSVWIMLCWLSTPLAVPVVHTVRTRTDGPSLNQRAGGHRAAAAGLLRAALRRPAALLTDGAAHRQARPAAVARAAADGVGRAAGARAAGADARVRRRATRGAARPRRWSPMTACRSGRSPRRWRPTARCWPRPGPTTPTPICWPHARRSGGCPRRSPPSIWPCGTGRAAARAGRSRRCSRPPRPPPSP